MAVKALGPVARYWQRLPSWARTSGLSVGVGLIAGGLSAFLFRGLRTAHQWLLEAPLHMPEGQAGPFQLDALGAVLLVLIPALGGLAVGLIAWRACAQVKGGGTELILHSFHHDEARLPGKLVPFKWLASCLTVGSGGSGGTEGPISLIGAAAGSWLAQKLDLELAERRLLFTAGLAGGIGSVFRAPLGGALFACEIYYSGPGIEQDALVPALLSAVAANQLFTTLVGEGILLPGETPAVPGLSGLVWSTAITLAAVLAAHLLNALMRRSARAFSGLSMPWRPALGGLATGLVALAVFGLGHAYWGSPALSLSVLAEGYPMLQTLTLGTVALPLLAAVALGKMATTSFTLGSGGSGGVFAPCMVLGGCVGFAVASLGPALGLAPFAAKPAVLAGIAALFSAGTACPLSALFLTMEVSQGFHLLPLLMWVVGLAYLLRPRPSFFDGQELDSAHSPAHREHWAKAQAKHRRL